MTCASMARPLLSESVLLVALDKSVGLTFMSQSPQPGCGSVQGGTPTPPVSVSLSVSLILCLISVPVSASPSVWFPGTLCQGPGTGDTQAQVLTTPAPP